MKRVAFLLFLALTVTVAAQEKQVDLGLIPTPQRVEMDAGGKECVVKKSMVKEVGMDNMEIDIFKSTKLHWVQANMDQAYVLKIEPKRITIEYYNVNGDEGLKYAYMTLEQLKLIHGDTLPCCTITDWPALEYRGWMDDISRKPVTKLEFIEKQADILSRYKYNYGSYYTEHTGYNPEYPDLSSAEYQLPDGGKDRTELMANLQCFGHFEETLKHPFYKDIRDAADVVNPSSEKTYAFLRSQIANMLRAYPWLPLFNINCDETETLGTGYARDYVDRLGADEVYCQHINRVYTIVQDEYTKLRSDTTVWFRNHLSDHIDVLMWGDIVAKNPAMLRQLPKNMNYVAWYYVAQPHYRDQIAPFRKLHEEQGTPFWVAPGVSHSGRLAPVRNYIENIAYLTRDGYQAGARGMMNTAWDDYGEPLFADTWHGMLWGAEMAWNPLKNSDPTLAAQELAERERQFNINFNRQFPELCKRLCPSAEIDTGVDYAAQIYAVAALEQHPAVADWYNYAALQQPLFEFFPSYVDDAMLTRCNTVDVLADSLLREVDSVALPYYVYYLHRLQTVSLKSRLRVHIYRAVNGDAAARQQVRQLSDTYFYRLHAIEREYLRLWDQENIGYDRHEIVDRFDALGREVLALDRHVFMSVGCDASSPYPVVTLRTVFGDRPVYYTLDGYEPTASAHRYEAPFPLAHSATVKAISYNDYGEGVITEQYLLSHLGMGAKIKLNTAFSTYKSIYSGGGEDALIDGQLGSNTTYADGHWQGYWGDSIDAVIDLGEAKSIHEVSMRFMQNTFDWILAPTEIKVYVSDDGKDWTLVADKHFDMDPRETGMRLKNHTVAIDNSRFSVSNYQFVRVVVPNPGPLPQWHPAPGQPSYLFTDEIVIR